MRRIWLAAVGVVVGGMTLARAVEAQTVAPPPLLRGTVTDTARRALAGATVLVRDTSGRQVTTAETGPDGAFQIPTLGAGTIYRVTARRLGYVPHTQLLHPLAAGDTVTLRFMLRDTAHALARVDVRSRAAPRPYDLDSTAIAKVAARDAYDVMVRYPWMLGDGLIECMPDRSRLMIGNEVDDTRDEPRWFAPTAGIGEPLRLFVDGQLRAEQGIKNTLADIPSDSIAEMHYVSCSDRERPQLRNSLLIVLKHHAPATAQSAVGSPQPATRPVRVPVGAIDTTVRAASATVSALVGVVVDSLHGAALSGAIVDIDGTGREGTTDSAGRYRIDSIPPGTHRVGLFHPLLDSLGLAIATEPTDFMPGQVARAALATPSPSTLWRLVCGADTGTPAMAPGTIATRHTRAAAVVGRVVDADTDAPVGGAAVSLAWTEVQLGKEAGMHHAPQTRTATTDVGGAFRLCAVPGPVEGTLQARLGRGPSTGEIPVTVPGGKLVLAELHIATPDTTRGTVASPGTGPAVVTGRIVTAAGAPIGGAVVTVLGATPSVLSQDSGAFALAHVPAGSQTLIVRAIGYAPAELPVTLKSHTPGRVNVTLVPAPSVLPQVQVEGARLLALQKVGFAQRQKLGIGHFLTDSALARHATANEVAELFDGMPGVRVEYVNGNAILLGNRGGSTKTLTGCVVYVLDDTPLVSVDTSAVNIDQYVQPSDIGAAEVYQPSETPAEFALRGKTGCITVVIWTKGKLGLP